MQTYDSIVIGAGQAGLSTAYHLTRLGVDPFVVLDANETAGGAWQHRWDTLTMSDVHGVSDLPGEELPGHDERARANEVVPGYFADYEQRHGLPVERPVVVTAVEPVDDDPAGLLRVRAEDGDRLTRTVVNATGTWDSPFVPSYPGMGEFEGRQLHTVQWTGPDDFAGQRVVVVGGGASAVQILGELAPVAETVWVTRREPVWRTSEFTLDAGRKAVALVEERVAQGLPPRSVVDVTGLILRPQEERARQLGAYERRPMFERVEPRGVRWADGTVEQVDAIVWATGFRQSVDHLGPLGLRSPHGGIQLLAPFDRHTYTTAALDHRVNLVGYGPSASTIGANRAGRVAARATQKWLAEHPSR
ncbi:NAD(P)-binding domain-containing protein [Ornithinimicrobium sufpigmenti]|uniref:NAD(P)-binding domain-containing protein n=1 Tax=Ornithinimicrobium sufpigmenti TaxID=2508882 RepID=UPI001036C000|nr:MULTISPECIES: NAD(P)-binding domain-containing protein [unclassified Ornithinimicrobium]